MELKPGYKQTAVGVIPEDWEVCYLEAIVRSDAPVCYGILMPGPNTLNGIPVVKVKDILGGQIDVSGLHLTHPEIDRAYKRSRLSAGDLLITIRGSTGRIAIVPNNLEGANITQDTARARLVRSTETRYVFFALQESNVQQQVELNTIGQAVKGINIRDVKKLKLSMPPLQEQRLIADALTNADKLINSLGHLIQKQQAIKQAAVQELLTGKRRLPGFEGEWEVKRLGSEIRHLQAGVSVTSTTDNDQANTDHYVLKTSAVFQGRFMPAEKKQISPGEVKRAKTSIRKGDLIISRMNTPALVGECGYSDSDYPNLFLPDRLWRADCRDPRAVSSRWLTYALSMQQNRLRIKDLATGTSGSMKNISKYSLLDLEIEWPSFTEQIALATVLSEMDNEIDLINEQLQKANSIKQGMMQQLLTGKIRLR